MAVGQVAAGRMNLAFRTRSVEGVVLLVKCLRGSTPVNYVRVILVSSCGELQTSPHI